MVEKKITRPFGTHEGPALEFKEAAQSLPKSFFETVCAFLNLDGGLIILGVADEMGLLPELHGIPWTG
ncbi:MAG: ATP-binding protein [Desulfobacterota bacterium]|nr:ATP-binding protein [Thermodesulfobacteriota bacterium]